MDTDVTPAQGAGLRPGPIAGGAVLLVLGVSMLLVDNGIIDVPVRRIIGPAFLIVLGALIMFEKGGLGCRGRGRDERGRMRVRHRGAAMNGLWLIGVGAWLLMAQTHAFGLDFHNSWPLFIVLGGVMMFVRGLR
jgi:hypothetical protein